MPAWLTPATVCAFVVGFCVCALLAVFVPVVRCW
jgi:hypothetical protein